MYQLIEPIWSALYYFLHIEDAKYILYILYSFIIESKINSNFAPLNRVCGSWNL